MSGRNCGRGADGFCTFLKILASLKEVRQVREARAVSSGSELPPYHALLRMQVPHTSKPCWTPTLPGGSSVGYEAQEEDILPRGHV